ncbi:transaldolase family protein [Ruminococcus gauvreauii]|uniref:Transaldolase n=1 Tax=Ruminococcus gauvreauii TaxID=438033 RepID=A0ABY5VDK7_9FIRM|nr:transaldolase family protein [Ruminococcus gauvreauii]UWP58312.1 hypothetical protein NQ502_13090 [Ruminococcus gauvreauii]
MVKNYLKWLADETPTAWWNDSAVPQEIAEAIQNGATGVTTNPVLTIKALQADPDYWSEEVTKIPEGLSPEERAEALLRIVAVDAAKQFYSIYEASDMQQGYALGQLNPAICHDSRLMLEQALRYHSWGDNIAVKLPTVKSALPVVEELAARGIAVCTTLNFSVSQGLSVGEAYERGVKKAKENRIPVRPCFVVQQGGRLDEYLTETAVDNQTDLDTKCIRHAGNAVCKKLYELFQKKGISAKIMPAGLRRTSHLTELTGSDMVFSLQPRVQRMVLEEDPPRTIKIDEKIPEAIIAELYKHREFPRVYDENGMCPEEFITLGVTQKTLSQFLWTGWVPLETYASRIPSSRWF